MVNKSTIERINMYIDSKHLRPMKKWSLRFRYSQDSKKTRDIKKIIKQIRNLLNFLSGNDIVEMLKGKFNIYIYNILK